ncbi:hypothetical protein B0H11DRAFT_1992249 [Mycena galericulata]|nr:hypothetical protein B0H11DRAFT_1992249 [Mycena galericulata]
MSSGPHILVAGALSFLQDLSNGSNIPALQPLVSVAVRIYTSAEAAKRNNKKAKALAQEACDSIKQILDVFPVGSSGLAQGLHEDGIREFQRALEDVATFVERISQRNRFWRFLNQQEDLQELSDYRMKITEAKLQFIVAMEMAKVQTLQQEQKYPVFTLADLELKQTLNQTNPRYTRAFARLVPHQKLVILRTYHTKSNFNQDIESLMSLRHPNLPFLGASSLFCDFDCYSNMFAPAPFIVMEMSSHSPVQSVIQDLYRKSPRVLQSKAIEIDAMNHLRENDIALSDLINQMLSIHTPSIARPVRWDKRIMGEEPKKTLTVSDAGVIKFDDEFCKSLATSLQPILTSFLQEFKIFDEESALPSALWPIWRYLMGCDLERRLHDLRNISEKLCGHSRLVVVCDILAEIRDEGIINMDQFVSTEIDDDEEQDNPSEELMRAGSGIFPEPVGDYTRYKCSRNRPFSLEISRTTTTSLHNPAASETRRRIQEYFHRRLPSLLEENTWVCEEPTDGFVLVTSVRSRRITQLRHNHNTFVEAQSEGCLQCIMYGGERHQPDAASNQDLKIDGHYPAPWKTIVGVAGQQV